MPQQRQVIAAGAIGNLLEWYDFAVYGYFAAEIGRVFFPHEEPVAQLLAAFGIFAVGFLMRPLGGVVVGYVGDRLGRRAALNLSILAMAVPTFLVGLLPGYATLGLAAPLLLVALRMIQGLSVGGEYTTSIVFVVEHAPPGRRGLSGAVVAAGAIAGILLGSAMGAALTAILSADALAAWGWRIPFLAGLAVGLLGFLLRREVQDAAPPAGAQLPLLERLRRNRVLVLRLAAVSIFNGTAFYLPFVYIVSWLQSADGLPPDQALGINTVSMAALVALIFLGGWLSDRAGRRPVLLLATGLACLGAVPFFWLMHHPDPGLVLLGQMGFVLATGLFLGAQPAFLVEAVPAEVRCTAIGLGYNVMLALVGGTSPMAATWLVYRTGW